MKKNDSHILTALAIATSAFISMPTSAAQPTNATNLRRRTSGVRQTGYRTFAGPISVNSLTPRVQFNAWRPNEGSNCRLGVRVEFINTETGKVLQTSKIFDARPGHGLTARMRVENSDVRLLGARMSVRSLDLRSID